MKGNYIITPYIVELMQNKIPFMVFYDNRQLLEGDEVQNWIDHQSIFGDGILVAAEKTPYMIGHHITDKNGRSGYCIKDTRSIYSLMIPDEIIQKGYDAVMKAKGESV